MYVYFNAFCRRVRFHCKSTPPTDTQYSYRLRRTQAPVKLVFYVVALVFRCAIVRKKSFRNIVLYFVIVFFTYTIQRAVYESSNGCWRKVGFNADVLFAL